MTDVWQVTEPIQDTILGPMFRPRKVYRGIIEREVEWGDGVRHDVRDCGHDHGTLDAARKCAESMLDRFAR